MGHIRALPVNGKERLKKNHLSWWLTINLYLYLDESKGHDVSWLWEGSACETGI